MKLRPLGKRIVVEFVKPPDITRLQSGIFVPTPGKNPVSESTVKAIGDEVTKVKEGDKIMYAPFSALTLDVDEQKVIVIDEKDVIAVRTDS